MSVHNQVKYSGALPEDKPGILLTAPVSGKVSPLTHHSNPLFNQGILGCGLTIEISGHTLYAPFDGSVEQVKHQGREIILRSSKGVRVLLSFDIEPSQLPLIHFKPLIGNGEQVALRQALLHFDLRTLPKGCQLALVLLNHGQMGMVYFNLLQVTAAEDPLMKITLKTQNKK